MKINKKLNPTDLFRRVQRLWQISDEKIKLIGNQYDDSIGSPVFTVDGKYTSRGWTEWTQGFQLGSSILQFDTTGDFKLLETTRQKTLDKMVLHVSHTGVHDHGFNNISTYGNLLRLMREGKIPFNEWEKNFYELALKISGAVKASRWTTIHDGGFIHISQKGSLIDLLHKMKDQILTHFIGFFGYANAQVITTATAISTLCLLPQIILQPQKSALDVDRL